MRTLLLIFSIVGANQISALGLDKCFEIAANRYQIPSKLLKAIARTETKMNPVSVGINNNRTYDIGLMQINSS
jgi:soluble lytic murein transglycosylase-like protein